MSWDWTGVQINVIKDYNLDEQWGTLGSADETHLKKLKIRSRRMICTWNWWYVTLSMNGLTEVLRVAHIQGARFVRSYVPITINQSALATAAEGAYDIVKVKQDFDPKICGMQWRPFVVSSHCLKVSHYIMFGKSWIWNSRRIIALVQEIASPWVQLLFDFEILWWPEDPMTAVRKMAPYVKMTHRKDHIIIPDKSSEFGYVVWCAYRWRQFRCAGLIWCIAWKPHR